MSRTVLLASLVLVASCSGAKPIFDDGGLADGGADAGIDAGEREDGGFDGGRPDSGIDAGSDDAGADAGADAGERDAGPPCTPEGYAECDGTGATVCETYTWADEAHCGRCDTSCDASRLCVAGACRIPLLGGMALGAGHTCARTTSGHVLCWGRDHRGQLGDGSFDDLGAQDRPDAVAVVDLDDAVDLDADAYTACAIRGAERVVSCWGSNSPARFGPALGARSVYARPEPLLMDGAAEPVLEVSLTGTHVCARTATRVLCAGYNGANQLGRPDTSIRTTVLGPVEGLPAGAPRSIAVGGPGGSGHTCVAWSDGNVYCFGYNDDRQCAQPTVTTVPVPTQVPGLTDVQQVVAGIAHTCALTSDGFVYCWGRNSDGQLGGGTIGTDSAAPTRAVGLPPIRSLAAGGAFVLAVAASGDEVWGWGQANSGQLGRGPSGLSSTGTPVRILATASASYEVSAGTTHSCIVERRGGVEQLLCAGANGYGELGRAPPSGATVFERSGALP